jgi:hypothetical protein
MLILDKQRAVERVVALMSGAEEVAIEPPALLPHTRTYQRIATYERRAHALPLPLRRAAERKRRRMRLADEPFPLRRGLPAG